MKEFMLKLVPHILPIVFGVGSLIMKYNNISGWWIFFVASIFLALNVLGGEQKNEKV